jgi:cell division septation protein DedD
VRKDVEVPVEPGVVRDVDLQADHAEVVARADRPAPPVAAPPPAPAAVTAQAVVPRATAPQDAAAASPSAFLVQVGTFAIPANADALMRQLQNLGIPTLRENRGRFIVVDAGPFPTSADAKRVQDKLHHAGLEAELRHPTPAAGAAPAPSPRAEPDGEFAVQIGAFREKENAREAQREAAKANLPTFTTQQHALVIVQAGPFATRQKADDARQRLARHRIDGLVVRNTRSGRVHP